MSSPQPPPETAAAPVKDAEKQARKRQDMLSEIAAFFAEGPLYRRYRYEGSLWNVRDVNRGESIQLPHQIRLFCSDPDCGRAQLWEGAASLSAEYGQGRRINEFRQVKFECRNCGRSRVTIFLLVAIGPNEGELMKVGQYPPLSREADPVVTAGWQKSDVIPIPEGAHVPERQRGHCSVTLPATNY